ncbi:MAG: ChbG/HpnK family deacetylase, partial [Planctomycetes bacterium]|nr:ChbG/HpnK family deacetylase [Planctomycetota bacterium]
MIEKKLIVCADDFGLTEGVNEGIVDAYRKGIVTRTSIIANGRAFDHAVLSAKKNEGLKVGIHLTLVEEVPVDQRKKNNSLTGPNGKFPLDYKAFLVRYIYRKINPNEVYLEWESQIRKALGSGLEINHI